MKSVMLSIDPKWCELIASGKKIIEVRKTRPKISTPFKCYIYCTKPRMVLRYVWGKKDYEGYGEPYTQMRNDEKVFCKTPDGSSPFCSPPYSGKVIGEFVCDTIITDKTYGRDALFNAAACMSEAEATEYSSGRNLYGWHISSLKLYDTPKELSEFRRPCKPDCIGICNIVCPVALERPPQSWCYCTKMSVILD